MGLPQTAQTTGLDFRKNIAGLRPENSSISPFSEARHRILGDVRPSETSFGSLADWRGRRKLLQVAARACQWIEQKFLPALQRLLVNGWATAEWGTSDNNRRARYYTLTRAGRRQLAAERAEFERMVGGIQGVLRTT